MLFQAKNYHKHLIIDLKTPITMDNIKRKYKYVRWKLTNSKKLLLDFIQKETPYTIKEKEYSFPPYFRYAMFKNDKQITDYFEHKSQAISNLINFEKMDWYYDK